jgi:hypothetical protein
LVGTRMEYGRSCASPILAGFKMRIAYPMRVRAGAELLQLGFKLELRLGFLRFGFRRISEASG